MKLDKKCIAVTLGLFGALGLVSCSDDNPWSGSADGTGGIRPAIHTDANVTDVVAMTKGEVPNTPSPSEFALELSKTDGTYTKNWANPDLFPTDEAFPVGDYTLTATYGDIDAEGFNKPCFQGVTNVTVKPGETTDAQITATLANCMVTIEYTDAFKQYFSTYYTTLHSAGHGYNTLQSTDTEPLYLAPGNVEVSVTFTKQNGQGATVQPASFEAKPRHHYYITMDVNNGGVGSATLQISFDDSIVESEAVDINLSDELLNLPEPIVKTEGFTTGTTLNVLQTMPLTGNVRFNVTALAGFNSATLNLVSDTYTLPGSDNNSLELVGLDAVTEAVLNADGIKLLGLTHNPDKLAYVDLTNLLPNLPAGTHEFTLTVKDKLTRINNPIQTLTVTVDPVELSVVKYAPYFSGSTEATITVAYNGADPASNISFQIMNENGIWEEAPVKTSVAAVKKYTRSDAFPAKSYVMTIVVPALKQDIPVRIFLKGKQMIEGVIPCDFPVYTAQADAFASQVVLQVTPEDASLLNYIVSNLRVFVTGASNPTITRDASSGLVYVKGLTPGTEYTVSTTLMTGSSPSMTTSQTLTTESALGVPNGDFEDLTSKLSVSGQLQGGKFERTKIASVSGQNTQSFSLSEPTGWATTNAKTYNESSSNANSWFRTLSVYNTGLNFVSQVATVAGMGGQTSTPGIYQVAAQNGSNAMAIRNVAYAQSGTTPSTYKWTAARPDSYYNPTAPTVSDRAAGRLFLGTYSYASGSETYNQGVAFASRPTALNFYYKYVRDANDSAENGIVIIQLLNGSTVIGQGSATLTPADAYTLKSVNIAYSTLFKSATTLRIMFCSSNHYGTIAEESASIKTTNNASLYLQESYGALLTVDNLTFTY